MIFLEIFVDVFGSDVEEIFLFKIFVFFDII
jgi:hypothetical protein